MTSNSTHLRINVDQIDPDGEFYGLLTLKDTGEEIRYVPFQFSHFSVGIIARAGLDVISDLLLNTPGGPVTMRILSVETHDAPKNACRYHLMAVGLKESFEQIYANQESPTHVPFPVAYTRFETLNPVVIRAKTFGATNHYVFRSINASKSGLQIMLMDRSKAPFSPGTLVEFEIEPNGDWLDREIRGHAVIERLVTHMNQSNRHLQFFGISIKEFASDQAIAWARAVALLEESVRERYLKELNRSA